MLPTFCVCFTVPEVHAAHHTESRPGRADHRQSSDPQSKRPKPASAGLQFLLTAYVPVSSCTVPRRHGRITHQPEGGRTEALAQTCRAIIHRRTGHRGLKSMTEQLEVPSSPQCLTVLRRSTAGFSSPATPVWRARLASGATGRSSSSGTQFLNTPPHWRQISRPQLRTNDSSRTTRTRNTEDDVPACR